MDQFLRACRGREPLKLEVFSGYGGEPTVVDVEKPFVLIGRGKGADVSLTSPAGGPRQLYLQLLGGRLFALQLSDDGPTLVDGRKWKRGWVQPEHEFVVGKVRLRVTNPDHRPAGSPVLADNPMSADPTGRTRFSFEPVSGKSRPNAMFHSRRRLLVIGRAAPSRFVVGHDSVSRVHAAAVSTSSGLWIVDLMSHSGTLVNGSAVTAAPLQHGDRVTLGDVEFRVHIGLPADTPETAARDEDEETAAIAVPGPAPVPAPVVAPPAEVAVPADQVLGPVLEQMAQFQQQTFDQFREMVGTMMQVVGTVMKDHREFVQQELRRLEKLHAKPATPALPAAAPQSPAPRADRPSAPAPRPASPTPRPTPVAVSPPGAVPLHDATEIHAWLEQQLGTMESEQSTAWKRFVQKLTGV